MQVNDSRIHDNDTKNLLCSMGKISPAFQSFVSCYSVSCYSAFIRYDQCGRWDSKSEAQLIVKIYRGSYSWRYLLHWLSAVTTKDRVSPSAGEAEKYFCRYQIKLKRRKNTRERRALASANLPGKRFFSDTLAKRRAAAEFSVM